MINKLLFISLAMASQIVAMDALQPPVRKILISNGIRIEGSCADRVFDAHDAQNEKIKNAWSALIKQAPKALQGSQAEMGLFFDQVLKQVDEDCTLPGQDFGYMLSAQRLFHLAVFCKNNSHLKSGQESLWHVLVKYKRQIDCIAFNSISISDRKVMYQLSKDETLRREQTVKPSVNSEINCFKGDTTCRRCLIYISLKIGESVNCCCKDTVTYIMPGENAFACQECGHQLQKFFYCKLKNLVIGLHQFGFPLKEADDRALVKWAILYTNKAQK